MLLLGFLWGCSREARGTLAIGKVGYAPIEGVLSTGSPPGRGRRYYRNRSGIAILKCLESVSESNRAHPWVSVPVSESNLWVSVSFQNRSLIESGLE